MCASIWHACNTHNDVTDRIIVSPACLQFAARGAGAAAAAAAGRRWAEQRGACQPPHFPSQQDGLTTAASNCRCLCICTHAVFPCSASSPCCGSPWLAIFCAPEFITRGCLKWLSPRAPVFAAPCRTAPQLLQQPHQSGGMHSAVMCMPSSAPHMCPTAWHPPHVAISSAEPSALHSHPPCGVAPLCSTMLTRSCGMSTSGGMLLSLLLK